jgi:Domain of unknown function (DUF1707)
MAAMDTPNRSFPRGDLRVSDADRDRAVAELSEHFQSGRLTQEEFEDRSGRALQARTGSELSELFADLPGRPAPSAGMPPAMASPGSIRRRGGVPVAGIVIAVVVASIVVGNVFSGAHHVHGAGFGWLVPVLILGFVFRRVVCGRR